MKEVHYAYELGYDAYRNGQSINPFEDEVDMDAYRYNQWACGWANATEDDQEPIEGDYFNDEVEYPQ